FPSGGVKAPILAALHNDGSATDLFTWRDGKLIPLIVPTATVSGTDLQLLGAGVSAAGGNEAGMLDLANKEIVGMALVPPNVVARRWEGRPWGQSRPPDRTHPLAKRTRLATDGTMTFALVGSAADASMVACVVDYFNGQLRVRTLPAAGYTITPD